MIFRFCRFIVIALILACGVSVASAKAAVPSEVQFVDAAAVDAFYAARNGQPFWTNAGGLNRNGRTLLKTLEKSWTHGLNPATYHLEVIYGLQAARDDESRNWLENIMSDALVRYVRDMTGMRVDPGGLLTDRDSWRVSWSPIQALDLIDSEPNMNRFLRSIEPQSRTYTILRQALEDLTAHGNPEDTKNVRQIIANLERLRWVKPDKPARHIVVNVPSATVWAMHNGQAVVEEPVIVGRKSRPTYTFVNNVRGVRLNPHWTVPQTIKREDILPKAQEDPSYLQNKGIELIRYEEGSRLTVDPASVDWMSMTPEQFDAYTLVQVPGGHNPLGSMRVLMYNDYDIYLHGTNRPDQLSYKNRALSSGCVRLDNKTALTNFILSEREVPPNSGKTVDVVIDNPIPVYLFYFTVWVGPDGEIVYGPDIYGLDDKLLKKLDAIDGYSISMK